MASSGTLTSGIAARYASSLFELAREGKSLDTVEKDLGRFGDLIQGSDDMKRLLRSPVFSVDEQSGALKAIMNKAGVGGLVANFVQVVASNRRLFALADMISKFRDLLAEHRGEVSADVTVAEKLTAAQQKELKSALKASIGKDVSVNEIVDPSILGGMIVKVGSRQIDTSLRTKLSSLKLALKEVG